MSRGLIAALTLALLPLAPSQAISYPDKTPVDPAAAPWAVALWRTDQWQDRDPDGFFCTGSLLDDYTVITAAHCLELVGQDPYVVVHLQNLRADYGTVMAPRAVRYPPGYKPKAYVDDLALIDLYQPSGTDTFLKLPSKARSAKLLAAAPRLYGWGRLQDGSLPTGLRTVGQKDKTKEADLAYNKFNPVRQIGATRRNYSGTVSAACRGDSGGPLVGAADGKSFLLGVVSYGASLDCKSKVPVVYSRVSYYLDWIKSQRAGFALERQQLQIDLTQHFQNLPSDPLPTTTSPLDPPEYYIEQSARFVTEGWLEPLADPGRLWVRNFSIAADGWQTALRLETREAWPVNGCGWGVNGTYTSGARLTLQLRELGAWRTGVHFDYRAPLNGCLEESGLVLLPLQVGREPMAADCRALIRPAAGYAVEVLLRRSCFTDPSQAYLRLSLSAFGLTRVLPGPDQWVGPLDLSQPVPAP